MLKTSQSEIHPETLDHIIKRCSEKYGIPLEEESATDFLDWYIEKYLQAHQDKIARFEEDPQQRGYPINELIEAVAVLGIYQNHLKKKPDTLTLPDMDKNFNKYSSVIDHTLQNINDYSGNTLINVPLAKELGDRVREYLISTSNQNSEDNATQKAGNGLYKVKRIVLLGDVGVKIYLKDATRDKVVRFRSDAQNHFEASPYINVHTTVKDIKIGCITVSNRASPHGPTIINTTQAAIENYARSLIANEKPVGLR
jgi:hypothetical protein